MVIAYLKSRHGSLRWRAAEIVGTVVQNDATAQQQAMDVGTLPLLLEAFDSGDDQVRKKVIYATSALVRHHPGATAAFLQHDGLAMVRRGLDDAFVDVQIKAVFFLLNLLSDNDGLKEAAWKLGLVPVLVSKLDSPNPRVRENLLSVLNVVATHPASLEVLRDSASGLRDRLHAILRRTEGLGKEEREAAEEETSGAKELLSLCFSEK